MAPITAQTPGLAAEFLALAGLEGVPDEPLSPVKGSAADAGLAAAAVAALLPPLPAGPAPPKHAAELLALSARLGALRRAIPGGSCAAEFLAIREEVCNL